MDKDKTGPVTTAALEWHIPDTIITRFASNMVVQSLEHEFKISFFEVNPGIQLGPEAKPPDKVQANCIASVIVSASKLPDFIGVLQEQLEQYNSRKNKA